MDIILKTTLTLPYSVNGYAGKGRLLLGIKSVDGGHKVVIIDLHSGIILASTPKFLDLNTAKSVFQSLDKNFKYAWIRTSEVSTKIHELKDLLRNNLTDVDMASSVFDSKLPTVILFENAKIPFSIDVSEGFKSLFNRCVNDAIANQSIK